MPNMVPAAPAAFLLLLCAAGVSAQWDPATGHIRATPGVPVFDPQPWDGAYKVTFRNLPKDAWPYAPYRGLDASRCSADGFDTTPVSSVELAKCFYKNNTGTDTFDFLIKESGLALQDANCYCYALNRFEGDYCHPGTSNGGRGREQYMEEMTCPALHTALTNDGAVPITRQQALSDTKPDKGHYIAAMARPDDSCVPGHCSDSDYHFARKDKDGIWSFKFPSTPATNRDLAGKLIRDPEEALLPGHYVVCGYYRVEPQKMPLGSDDPSPGPLADMSAVLRWTNKTGVSISPSPHNPATDINEDGGGLNAEDLAWELKRGTPEYVEWEKKQKEAVEWQEDMSDDDSSSNDSSNDSSKAAGRKLRFMV